MDAEWSFVGESECDRLAETAAGFNEDEFAADFLGRIGDAAEGDVGGELSKIGGVVGAQFRFVGGERAKSGFYLAEDSGRRSRCWKKLVDATGERQCPACVKNAAGYGNLKGGGGCGDASVGTKFLMPAGAKLCAPDALGVVT